MKKPKKQDQKNAIEKMMQERQQMKEQKDLKEDNRIHSVFL